MEAENILALLSSFHFCLFSYLLEQSRPSNPDWFFLLAIGSSKYLKQDNKATWYGKIRTCHVSELTTAMTWDHSSGLNFGRKYCTVLHLFDLHKTT